MADRGSIDELEHAAEYTRAITILRACGYGSVAFGVINIAIGIFALSESLLNIGLVLLGVVLLATGLWNALAPSAVGIIGDGISLLLAGLWNLTVTVLEVRSGAEFMPKFALLGILQVCFGVYRFVSFRRIDKAMLREPNPEIAKQLETLNSSSRAV